MSKNEIDNYMTVAEAAEKWGISQDTVKNKLKPSVPSSWRKTEQMIEKGMLKYHQKQGGARKEWIITTAAMEEWFGKKQ